MVPFTRDAVPELPELRFRSDPGIGPAAGAHYDSLWQLLRHAFRIYRKHFWTMVAIFTLPVLPIDLLGAMLQAPGIVRWIGLIPSLVAFSAIAIATSDVCNGNRPGIRRSFRRLGGRRIAIVVRNAVLAFFVIAAAPVASLYAPASCFLFLGSLLLYVPLMIVLLVNVPIISAVEARPGFVRALWRSIRLGRGHYLKVFILLCMLLACGGIVALLLALIVGQVHPNGAYFARYLFMPAFYIASVLLYYDLRARKEGYRSTELHEDII